MKVIDLLNKIANREEVPKKVKYGDKIYEYDCECKDYNCESYFLFSIVAANLEIDSLNDEVEIIEDNNKIEKLEQIITKEGKYNSIDELAIDVSRAFETIDDLIINQNKLIDKLEELDNERSNK